MNRTCLNALAAALAAASIATPAWSGSSDDPVVVLHLAAADQGDAWKRWADDFSHELRSSMGTMFSSRVGATKVVKGAPYSAEVVTENNQPLADGNTISRKSSGLIYRDGEGRTRQETPGDGKARTIFINDPVAAKQFVLTPGSRQAIETTALARSSPSSRERRVWRLGGKEVRIEDGKIFIDGKEVAGDMSEINAGGKLVRVEKGRVYVDGKEIDVGRGASRVVVKTIHGGESADGLDREEVRVQVIRDPNGATTIAMPPLPPLPPAVGGADVPVPPIPPLPPMPGLQTMRFESLGKLGKGVTSSLGTKEFDGVKAEGKSTVWTIPAGNIGNRNPINVTSESWYSPELQATVYSRYNDPRTGESIYRLAGIRRGEPAAALFTVPEGYKVRERTRK
jgi:hypothetical protein